MSPGTRQHLGCIAGKCVSSSMPSGWWLATTGQRPADAAVASSAASYAASSAGVTKAGPFPAAPKVLHPGKSDEPDPRPDPDE